MRRRGLLSDRRGTAAVEFALIFGLFLLPLFIGLIEVVTLYRAQEKLNAFVSNLALMVSIETPGSAVSGVYSLPATGGGAVRRCRMSAMARLPGLNPTPRMA